MKITTAVVAVWLAFSLPASPPKPTPSVSTCCKKCNNTGMVRSGDGVALIPCPCPSTCPCAKNRPKAAICTTGTCRVR